MSAASAASVAVDVGHYHARHGATSARGIPEFEYNPTLARDIAAELQRRGHDAILIGDEDYGVHYYDNLVVLHSATVPALLFEAGVLVNRHEELALRDRRVRMRRARSVVEAVDGCLPGRARQRSERHNGHN